MFDTDEEASTILVCPSTLTTKHQITAPRINLILMQETPLNRYIAVFYKTTMRINSS